MSFKRFYLKGMAICTLICTLFAVPSFAENIDIARTPNIRYLGGDVAANSSFGLSSNILNILKSVDCSKHNEQNGYYNEIQNNMDCVSDPFCVGKWHCYTNCLKDGFVDGVADSKDKLTKKEPDYTCEDCQMKGETYWRCVPNECAAGLFRESQCEQWKKFVPKEGAHRYGNEMCGTCETITDPCGKEMTLDDVRKLIEGDDQCYTCDEHHSVPGENGDIKCYTCKPLAGYKRGAKMDSNTCYTYYNTSGFNPNNDAISSTTSNCYKRLLHVCEIDKYLTGKKAEGGNVSIEIEMTNGSGEALDISSHDDTFLVDQANQFDTLVGCECRDYIYDLKVEPEHADITAAGGTVTFTVTSTRTGPSANAWDYDFIPRNNLCSVVKNGTQFQVTCPRRAANDPATFGVTFKQVTRAGVTKQYPYDELITILADKCPDGQSLSNSCSGGLVVQKSGDFSDAGQPCYKCVDDVCPEGQFACGADEAATPNGKTSPSGKACYSCKSDKCPDGYTQGTAPTSEGYDVTSTETGKPCYKKLDIELPDMCPSGYDTEPKNCGEGYVLDKQGTTNGKDCTKCTPDTCPSPSGCKDYPYCPATNANCEGKVNCNSKAIAGVTKYYDCKCDVKPCGDANKRYDETTCSCIDKDCAEGYSKDVANCKDGEELSTDPNNSSCKRCQAKACDAGLSETKIVPRTGADATGNPYVSCKEVKCEGATKYKDCVCNVSDGACGAGKYADEYICSCKDCTGIPAGDPKYDRYVCTQSWSCNGQKRYISASCDILGSQWSNNDRDCACPNNKKTDINGLSYCDTQDKSCVPADEPKGCTATNSSWLPEAQALSACKNGAYICTKLDKPAENGEICYTITPRDCKKDGYTLNKQPSSGSDTYDVCLTGGGKMYKCNSGYTYNSGTNTCAANTPEPEPTKKSCNDINSNWFAESQKSNQKCGSGYDCTYVDKAENGDSCYTRTVHNCGSSYNLDLQPSSGSDTYDTCLTGEGAVYKCKTNYVFSEDAGNQCILANTCPSTYPEEAAATCTKQGRTYTYKEIGNKLCYNCGGCDTGNGYKADGSICVCDEDRGYTLIGTVCRKLTKKCNYTGLDPDADAGRCRMNYNVYLTFSVCKKEDGGWCPYFENAISQGDYAFGNCPNSGGMYRDQRTCEKEFGHCQPVLTRNNEACYRKVTNDASKLIY